ncbi:MAG: PhnD/SsuA/transferrin family substrate-binding protein, partial [Gammaproteobacteria bacterium]|nr:PhnD/SsuA/transferrin family substrate-binding protein [Gammaproteobacteria bacterium]
MTISARLIFICAGLLVFSANSVCADEQLIRIGVLSHRGDEVTQQMWSPTAQYLTDTLDSYRFKIIPLDFAQIDAAVSAARIDFLLVNSGIYVNMEVRHRVSRIVTLNNRIGDVPLNVFGGVIFTRKIRHDIQSIDDLRGKKFMAVDETSLGGFQMAWGVIHEQKMNPYRDFASVSFGGTHDEVVMAVREGRVDAGTVRSGILEKISAQGEIRLDEFKIIHPVIYDGFPYIHSTPLYPEWPFSKLQHTSNQLAQKVAVALLNMNISQASEISHYAGWTVPLDYQQVHGLFQRLNLPPYELQGRFTLLDAIKRYWKGIVIILLFLLMLTVMSTWVSRLNTQLKKSKRSLEYQHDLVLNSVCDGIYGVDLKGNCTFMNRSMKKLTGWQLQDMMNDSQHELLHHTHEDGTPHNSEECPVYLTFRDNQPRFVADDVFWKKDGSSFPVEYSSTPMKDHKGDTIGSVVVFRDISERKQAEEDIRRHQKELAHMARLNTMGEMASGIAHELNQPLTAIATNSFACIQMLENGTIKSDKLMDVLETIGLQAEHSGEIIRQLRQFVRKEQPERSVININGLIEEVLLFIKPEARKARVKINQKLDNHISKVLAQPIQIEQVVLNLLKNSIEALQNVLAENRYLTISTEMAGDNALVVTVEDTGPGIDDNIKSGLFDPFITSKDSGLGLGLSISQGIIESHQGKLYLHSASDRGT